MMNCLPHWLLPLIVLLANTLSTDAAPSRPVSGCAIASQQLKLRLRSNNNAVETEDEEQEDQGTQLAQLDLGQLSEKQLKELMQQLHVADQLDEDHRGSSRPWNKIQRIIRRQLIRIPKRYLKKILRQFGLARSDARRSAAVLQQLQEEDEEPQLYYLIPLE